MQSVWEYVFPVTIIGVFCAVMAAKKGRNPILWFSLGFVGNFVAVIFASTLDDKNEKSSIKTIETKFEKVSLSKDTVDELNGTLIGAAVCLFVWAAITGLFSILQVFNINNTEGDLIVIGWNILVSSLFIVFGIGILKMTSWGYTWALWSTLLNMIVVLSTFSTENVYSIIITPLQLAIIGLLLFNWKTFR